MLFFSLWSIIQSLRFHQPPRIMPAETIPRLIPLSSLTPSDNDPILLISVVFERLSEGYKDSGVDRIAQLQGCTISRLYLCKSIDSFQHEFVVAAVHDELQLKVDPSKSNVYYLRLERDSLSDCSDPLQLKKGTFVKQSKINGNPALDTVRSYHNNKREVAFGLQLTDQSASPAFTCWTVEFPDDLRPNLIELISAAQTLHHKAPNYTLARYMCYWFGHNLLRLLTYKRPYTLTINPNNKVVPGCLRGTAVLTSVSEIRNELRDQNDSDDSAYAKFKEVEDADRLRLGTGENDITVGSRGVFIQPDIIHEYYDSYLEWVEVAKQQILAKEDRAVMLEKQVEVLQKQVEALQADELREERDKLAAQLKGVLGELDTLKKEKHIALEKIFSLESKLKDAMNVMDALRKEKDAQSERFATQLSQMMERMNGFESKLEGVSRSSAPGV